MSAGKGDKPRPVNINKFSRNYDNIFRSFEKEKDCTSSKCVNKKACSELGYCIRKFS
jgi:hypothetical protein